jgi:hypothetical protein
MKFHLFKTSGYEEAIMSLRMSKGKFYSWEKAQQIQHLVYVCTNQNGSLNDDIAYHMKLQTIYSDAIGHPKITGDYEQDIAEFKRLLGITFDNSMGHQDHHTLMKYIDVSFFTDGLHRGAQDDLDAHAMGFNNRITRFSTRLASEIPPIVSEWYQGKIIPFHDVIKQFENVCESEILPEFIEVTPDGKVLFANDVGVPVVGEVFKYTPFGYVLKKYADMNHEASIRKDVLRGLVPLGTPGPALWKTDLWNLRYIYFRRGELTKANPELKIGMEQLADQIEQSIPVFGPYFRMQFTDTNKWEHMHKVRTVAMDEWKEFQLFKSFKGDVKNENNSI